MSASPQESWVEYYQRVYANDNSWLDYSNAHVQGQTFGIAIEAAGPLGGKRCLDIGCGRGQLSLAVAGLQASEVVGVDIIAESINACRVRFPHVRWEVGSPEDARFCESLGQFDVIFIIELLQLVDWRKTLKILWDRVSPGGRIVAIVPNKDNPIVQKTMARFATNNVVPNSDGSGIPCVVEVVAQSPGSYIAPNPTELTALVGELANVECWAYRGMDFQQDQRIVPYVTSPWTNQVIPDFASNRMVVAIQKQSGGVV